MIRCDGFPEPGCGKEAEQRIFGYDLCSDCARTFVSGDTDELRVKVAQLEVRLSALKEILTDPVNQLEQTKGGYYIYRFDLETMHRIADAIGLPKAGEVLASYTPQELTKLIR